MVIFSRQKINRIWVIILSLILVTVATSCALVETRSPISVEALTGTWVYQDELGHVTTLEFKEDLTWTSVNMPYEVVSGRSNARASEFLDWTKTSDLSGTWNSEWQERYNSTYLNAWVQGPNVWLTFITERENTSNSSKDDGISIYVPFADLDSGLTLKFERSKK